MPQENRVITIKDGEQITKAGIYIIPIERYHSDPDLFPSHSVSSTGLRRMASTCPKKYWANSIYNPDCIPQKFNNEALRFGKAVHAFLLERDLPDAEFAYHEFENWSSNEGHKGPHEADGFMHKSYLAYKKDWKEQANAAGKTVVSKKDIEIFKAMALELAGDDMIEDLFDGLVEHSICWQDPETGIWIKIRPDVIPTSSMIGDYKTSVSAAIPEVEKAISNYGYDMQMALCMEGVARVLGIEITSPYFVVQEKEAPYVHSVTPVDKNTIWWGMRRNRKALNDIKAALDSGVWDGYTKDGEPVTAGLTEWKTKQLQRQDEFDPFPDPLDIKKMLGLTKGSDHEK